ncbi:hypothetical protein FEM48_Zijuj11G0130500 [Ziziphus jujuba var. spinosa]|uniref:Cytosine-specific methyltransferase n=1 Tax=Ziziphus jujuba var. spinosa TaxID=714518 RepID=A0A978UJ33_ZIZJJ|nr:hypothetical protein FEM48_Zijuj11G0130500 [Ziziphus jujuba var. spinosa]
MTPPPTSESKSESVGSKSESLIVIGEEEEEDIADEEDRPKPLNMYHPNSSADKISLRKSPRLNPIPKELKPRNVARKWRYVGPEMRQRRSPRLSTGANGNAETSQRELADSPAKKLKMNSPAMNSGVEFARKSTRFASPVVVVSGGHAIGNAVTILSELADSAAKRETKRVKMEYGNCGWRDVAAEFVRRSPRFSTSVIAADIGKSMSDFVRVRSQKSKSQNLKPNGEEEEKDSTLECFEEECRRRSPGPTLTQSGIDSGFSKASMQKISMKKVVSPKNGSVEPLSSKSLNLTTISIKKREKHPLPRELTLNGNCDTVPMLLKCYETQFFGEKQVRRSPRLVSATKNGVGEDVKMDMETLDETSTRSTGCSSSLAIAERIRTNSNGEHLQCPRGVTDAENVIPKCTSANLLESYEKQHPEKIRTQISSKNKQKSGDCTFFIGDPVPNEEAQERWRWRYELKSKRPNAQTLKLNDDDEDEVVLDVECHFAQAKIHNNIFSLGDCAYIQGDEKQKHVGRIIEFFRTTSGEEYFRVQWFYRVEDTIIKEEGAFHDKRRLFYSTVMNDNLIDCIISKVNVSQLSPRVGVKLNSISPSDFYYDMEYCVDYSTFRSLVMDDSRYNHYMATPSGIETVTTTGTSPSLKNKAATKNYTEELALLDLYCGCGGMSTGLCLGAKLSSVNLVTRWALDSDESACESLKLNHPRTHVRNEAAEDFLELLREWEKLCKRYKLNDVERTCLSRSETSALAEKEDKVFTREFEVSRLVDICYGDPNKTGKRGLNFKVHWKGYSSSEDTWEPVEGLRNCQERLREFVRNGMKLKILPLPGSADVICGGPPCQGISGYNRFRNIDSPLEDERNRQIIVFMDIVKFLKPRYVLMENVPDILRFDKASLGRYAISRLVHMKYQARLGMIAAGCYGLPQFRLRVFLWGAHHSENLPQFPLPTHDVVVRYWPPAEFERNTVAYDEDQPRELENAVVLQDAISELPAVTNDETREEMPYQNPPETEFQRFIRSTKFEMTGSAVDGTKEAEFLLYDHRAYQLNVDDFLRVCQIPKRKGANFRDLPGVIVGGDNVARRDPYNNALLPSGKSLVPDFAFTFEQGKSKRHVYRPYARLWWDETVPTVVTVPNCHNQTALHPDQDRILTIREYARLQGFPDYYRFCGTIKQRYCQLGNAVAVPVARALGYALGLAIQKRSGNEPLMTLPSKFSHSNYFQLEKVLSQETDQ